MVFKFIDEILGYSPNFKILERTSQRHNILLYQHEGKISGSDRGIGNSKDTDSHLNSFRSFFSLAKEKNAELALTPEYSCSWKALQEVIEDSNKWPSVGNLWALGCESITKVEIPAFAEKYRSEKVNIYFDSDPLNDNNLFFDPLVYLFVTKNNNHETLIILIQFKNYHSSVWGADFERNGMIQGKHIYILRNSIESIYFCSFICSEAMNVRTNITNEIQQKISWLDHPYIIFNPQLNPEPAHPRFIDFRRLILDRPKKEIIGLNWSMKAKLGSDNFITTGCARSGIMMQSPDFKETKRIQKNHEKGLYYFYFGNFKHAFLLNSYVNAYLISTTSVDIAGVEPQQAMRDGPELIETYSLNDDNILVKNENSISDGSVDYMTHLTCSNAFCINKENSITEKERLACLSSCEIEKALSTWFDLSNLFSIRLSDNAEINKRFTVAEDTVPDSVNHRKKYIKAIMELDCILEHHKDKFPDSIKGLRTKDLMVGYHSQEKDHQKVVALDKYKFNVMTKDGQPVIATLGFIDNPNVGEVNTKFELLRGLFSENDPVKRRVVIFFKIGNNDIDSKSDPSAAKIFDDLQFDGPDILNSNV